MVKLRVFSKTALCIIALLVAGCAGMAPYEPPAYDEAPPGRGLLSGEDGEFAIYVDLDENESVRVKSEEEAASGDKKP